MPPGPPRPPGVMPLAQANRDLLPVFLQRATTGILSSHKFIHEELCLKKNICEADACPEDPVAYSQNDNECLFSMRQHRLKSANSFGPSVCIRTLRNTVGASCCREG